MDAVLNSAVAKGLLHRVGSAGGTRYVLAGAAGSGAHGVAGSGGRVRYIALIHGDDKPGFGISFPDFPGRISDGATEEDAIRRGREALTFHVESMAEDGERIPAPSAYTEIEANPELAEWLESARLVEVEIAGPPPIIPPANDCLVRCVGEIFGRRLARSIERSVVPDLPKGNWNGVKVVLLLESPHKNEVRYRRTKGCAVG